jgi:hypothetical protein
MRRRPRPLIKQLPARRIYLDQIEELVSLLAEHCERLLLVSGDFEYDTLDDLLENVRAEKIFDLTIQGERPWIGVAMKYGEAPILEAEGGSPEAKGLANDVVEILSSGPRTVSTHSTVILKRRVDAPNFVQRNKDQLLMLLIGLVAGAVLTQIANVLFG